MPRHIHILAAVAVCATFPVTRLAAVINEQSYEEVLTDYCKGGLPAVTHVIAWSTKQVQEGMRVAESLPPKRRMVAAAMHLDAHSARWKYERGAIEAAHGEATKALVNRMRLSPENDVFIKRWMLASGYFLFEHLFLGDADQHFAKARAIFPRDVDFVVASGIVHELAAHPLGQQVLRGMDVSRDSRQRHLAVAASFYRLAGSNEPSAEAYLRLGRVESLTGNRQRAIASLNRVGTLTVEPDLVYTMHLFLGQVREDGGEWSEAEQHYQRAASLFPLAPTATIALYAVRSIQGRSDWSLQNSLPGSGRPGDDPWNEYLFTSSARTSRELELLRRTSCP